jgi:hypothetical protein
MLILKSIEEYKKRIIKRLNEISDLLKMNTIINSLEINTDAEGKSYVRVPFKFNSGPGTPFVDYKNCARTLAVLFPFSSRRPGDDVREVSINLYIEAKDEEDFEIILSMDNDSLKLYYELRK